MYIKVLTLFISNWLVPGSAVKMASLIQEHSYYGDVYMIGAIIAQESGYTSSANSNKKAKGLMQLTDIAIKEIVNNNRCGIDKTPDNIYDEKTNIELGSCFFSYLMSIYGNTTEALIHYNGGGAAVNALKEGKPYRESLYYVRLVNEYYNTLINMKDEMNEERIKSN